MARDKGYVQDDSGEEEKGGNENIKRKLAPDDIKVPEGYRVDVFAEGLSTPINLIITDKNEMLVADSGVMSGSGKVLKLTDEGFEIIADGFKPPLTGINYRDGDIYVSHRGLITVIKPDGKRVDIISGLPSLGDHHNNQVMFGPDGRMYFGQGTATNSGVVGLDNQGWAMRYPFFHDFPGCPIVLNGQNFTTPDILGNREKDIAATGAYSPFNMASISGEMVKGTVRASGSILSANADGSDLRLVAWGLRNPFRLKFDRNGRLFATNHGADVRGSRPIDKCPDEFQMIIPGAWYGWPDYSGGLPVTMPYFKPEGMPQPKFLLAYHPMVPPRPVANFPNHAAAMGFDFDYSGIFGPPEDAYVAQFGSEAPGTTGGKPEFEVGHRVSRVDMRSGRITTFAINKSGFSASHTGGGGFERPIDVVIDKAGTMYVVDFGMEGKGDQEGWISGSGVIWRIRR